MTRVRAALALLLIGLAGVLASATPAQAARTVTIQLTAGGPKPASVTIAAGDTVEFSNTDLTFVHGARAKSSNWSFDTGPIRPGGRVAVGALTKPGTYTYQSTNDLESFTGSVVVPAAAASSSAPAPSPTKGTASSPAPRQSPAAAGGPAPATASASPVASPAGGSGSVVAPPLTGFGGVGAPTAGPSGPAPNVAPVLPGSEDAASPDPAATGPSVAVSPGRLAEPSTARRYGLPAALAAVAAAGVASLLVRLLLAHPAARGRHGQRPGPAVTLD